MLQIDSLLLKAFFKENKKFLINARVQKVQQPTRREVILHLRNNGESKKLYININPSFYHICFMSKENELKRNIEIPKQPPMFCMLLRKHIEGARIISVSNPEFERIVELTFENYNEIGDRIEVSLCVEIMNKYSNLIFIRDGKIIDALKRVDITTSSVRQILPGMEYKLPPKQDKLNLADCDTEAVTARICSYSEKCLSGAIMASVQGVSPVVAREISHRICFEDILVSQLSSDNVDALKNELSDIKANLESYGEIYMLAEKKGKPKDMSHIPVRQYGDLFECRKYESPSELLDDFYYERDRINRINHRGRELIKLLNKLIERTARKISLQREELKRCEDKETLKLYGELIVANLYRLTKGTNYYEVENYYDNCNLIKIPCNPALSPAENQKKYYKDYRKAQTAEKLLVGLISQGENELVYLESVLDELSRADTDTEISLIMLEL